MNYTNTDNHLIMFTERLFYDIIMMIIMEFIKPMLVNIINAIFNIIMSFSIFIMWYVQFLFKSNERSMVINHSIIYYDRQFKRKKQLELLISLISKYLFDKALYFNKFICVDNKNSFLQLKTLECKKCVHPDTPILMFDGTIKRAILVNIGDQLMGDDSQPRNVLSLTKGRDNMYQINQSNGNSYIVNSSHILSLKKVDKNEDGPEFLDISLNDYRILIHSLKAYQGYKVKVDFKHINTSAKLNPYLVGVKLAGGTAPKEYKVNKNNIPNEYKCGSRRVRILLLAGIIDIKGSYNSENNQYLIDAPNQNIAKDIVYLCRSLGYKTINGIVIIISGENLNEIPVRMLHKQAHRRAVKDDLLTCNFTITEFGTGNYCGWELDGNGRFLLGDFTVTHNTSTKNLTYINLHHWNNKIPNDVKE